MQATRCLRPLLTLRSGSSSLYTGTLFQSSHFRYSSSTNSPSAAATLKNDSIIIQLPELDVVEGSSRGRLPSSATSRLPAQPKRKPHTVRESRRIKKRERELRSTKRGRELLLMHRKRRDSRTKPPSISRIAPPDYFTPAIPALPQPPPPPSHDVKRQHLLNLLGASLKRRVWVPSAIWTKYSYLQMSPGRRLPPAIHKRVLRKCTVPPENLRKWVNRKSRDGKPLDMEHPYEGRLRAVMDSMKIAGIDPDVSDYNYLMEHLAVVGQHRKCLRLLDEMPQPPPPESFDLCHHALAVRSGITYKEKEVMEQQNNSLAATLFELQDRMAALKYGFTPTVLESTLHVYRAIGDMDSLAKLLRVAYGIDLSNPDRHPQEFVDRMRSLVKEATASNEPLPTAPSIRSASLNTIISAHGQNGTIPQMVTAFEVLTAPLPLPSEPPTNPFGYDESEDDDPVFHDHLKPLPADIPPQVLIPEKAPRPNSFTYEQLIRYAAEAGNRNVAKHYLLAAMVRDRQVDAELRAGLRAAQGPCHRPAVAVSRTMFDRCASLVRSKEDVGYALWIRRNAIQALEWKRNDLTFYRRLDSRELRRLGMFPRDGRPSLLEKQAVVFPPTDPEGKAEVKKPFNRALHLHLLSREVQLIRWFLERLDEKIRGWYPTPKALHKAMADNRKRRQGATSVVDNAEQTS